MSVRYESVCPLIQILTLLYTLSEKINCTQYANGANRGRRNYSGLWALALEYKNQILNPIKKTNKKML